MDKGSLPNRVVYLSYTPEDQALTNELKDCLAEKDYPEPEFRFQKNAFAHTGCMNVKMNNLRIGDVICTTPIYPLWLSATSIPRTGRRSMKALQP